MIKKIIVINLFSLFFATSLYAVQCYDGFNADAVIGSYTKNGGYVLQLYSVTQSNSGCVTSMPNSGWSGTVYYYRTNIGQSGCGDGFFRYSNTAYAYNQVYLSCTSYYPDAPIPATCYNGIRDGQEEGIDCGDVCDNYCMPYWVCPDGYQRSLNIGTGEEQCVKYTAPDKLGNCPSGTTKVVGSDSSGNKITNCKHPQIEPQVAYTAPHIASDWSSNPEPVIPKPEWQGQNPDDKDFGYGVSVVEMVYPKETVSVTDNGDGTTTTVTKDVKTTSHGDGTSTTITTTTTTITNNSTGEIVSQGHETKTEGDDPTGNAANYSDSPGIDEGTGNEHGRFSQRVGAFVDSVRGAPIFGAFSTVLGGPSGSGSPVLSFDFGSYGFKQVDMSQYGSALGMVGYALIAAALFVAARLLIANK